LNRPPRRQALGLHQTPESLPRCSPASAPFGLTLGDIATVLAIFFIAELMISRPLFRMHVRGQPY
jgi:hypothetical protein